MITIKIGSKSFKNLPTSWAECNPKEVARLMPLGYAPAETQTEAFFLLTCQRWLNTSDAIFSKLRLARWQWAELQKTFSFIFKIKLENRPFAYFEHNKITYYLPAEKYADTTAAEVAWGNLKFLEYVNPENPNPKALDELMAIFCRPKHPDLRKLEKTLGWNNDLREPFLQQRAEARTKHFEFLDYGYKLAFVMWFAGMNADFLSQYDLFSGEDKAQKPIYNGGFGWIAMLMQVAKEAALGDFDKVSASSADKVWLYCLKNAIDNENARQQAEAQQEA